MPNKKALCSHVYHDSKVYLGESHPLVIDAGVVLQVNFNIDVKTTKMCYQCDRHTYPCNAKTSIKQRDGSFGPQECSRCDKAYVEHCDTCGHTKEPTFISENSSGVPGGQLFCPDCGNDHGVKRVWKRGCYACKNHVFLKKRGSDVTKYNCFICGAKMTQYCRDCRKDALIVRWADEEPRCFVCKDTYQAIEMRHSSEIVNKQRAQEKLAHVGKWIKAMWTGDFFQQVYTVWAKGAIDKLNKRRLMRKMLSRVLKRKLSEGFQGWFDVVQSLQKRRMDAVVRIDIMLTSSTKEKNTHFFKIWQDAWADFVALTAGQKEARRLFDVFDADGSGVISLQELRYRLADWGYDDDQIDGIMMKVDVNHDGQVTWDEFLQGFESFRHLLGLAVQD